ncbi:NAD-dependent epimerase/dehydratase family protein [Geobacter sp. FeAm09]|uniref:NAD(P)H-binding protein n=1 Tax=Geobacter sp. FeAm09 TaxID=2597769 RepID=UPI0011EE01A9|nr:NAD(P)H-binding protein [Geobacter sp. FeAm09]QEM66824.1 NAD-dependent epimerase/dehydratase family protein [Geobacter sp. FeAm09]
MEIQHNVVLITGATGFIGRRLSRSLLERGCNVRCMVRGAVAGIPDAAEVVRADMLAPSSLARALEGIDSVYYLVHSMAGGRAGFERRDREAAGNFVRAADKAGVRRVIYLGGLGETGDTLSEHLKSRREVAGILASGHFAMTFLRAAVIIGAGGASFEMVRALVNRLPVMITPRWVSTRCQPIAVDDVIAYLGGCLADERTAGRTFDIGGPEVLTYREMMERFARMAGRTIHILPVPVLTPKLSSYWVGLITPVPPSVSMPLIEGLGNEVVCREDAIRELIPLPLTSYDEAVRRALAENKR